MVFWDDKTLNLIQEYCSSPTNKLEAALKLFKQNPYLFEYILTTLDSCIGMHQVYLVSFKNESLKDMIKIGYTKHKKIEKRFGETRWGKKLIIDKIIRQEELPSAGAVEFEKYVKTTIKPEGIFEGSNPGKNEFYDISQLDSILKLWDTNISHYKEIWGIKPPN